MIVIGTFEYSIELELLLADIENNNIARKYIMIVPMEIDPKNPYQLDSKRQELHYKGIEIGVACGTGCSVLGTSVGFILQWGPIFWGLFAALFGFAVGFGIYFFITKIGALRKLPNKLPQIIVIVQCQDEQLGLIKNTMWKHSALTVGQQ